MQEPNDDVPARPAVESGDTSALQTERVDPSLDGGREGEGESSKGEVREGESSKGEGRERERDRDRDRDNDRERERPEEGGGVGGGGGEDRGKRREEHSIRVGNIPLEQDLEELRTLFTKYGTVNDVYIPRNHRTGRPSGYAFVKYEERANGERAIAELVNLELGGR